MTTMRAFVTDGCQGHGRCFEMAPAVFEPDIEGYAQVVGDGVVTGQLLAEAQTAVDGCPERALTLQ